MVCLFWHFKPSLLGDGFFNFKLDGGLMMKVEKNRIVISLVFVINLFLFPLTASAQNLDQGVTVSAKDQAGSTVLPMTAVEIAPGDTAYDALEEASQRNNVELLAPESEYGRFVEQIGDVASNDPYYWSFAVNGSPAEVGVSSFEISNGDNISFQMASWPLETIEATVVLKNLQGETILEQAVSLMKGSTAYDALVQATQANGLNLDATVHSQYFTAVNNIGDTELGETEYWAFKVNGEMANVGAVSYTLTGGETLSFEVTDWANPIPEEASIEEPLEEDSQNTSKVENDQANQLVQENESQANPSDQSQEEKNDQESLPVLDTSAALAGLETYFPPAESMTYGDEWKVWALSHKYPDSFGTYLSSVESVLKENNGQLRGLELQKIIISLSLLNEDATNFAGYNLLDNMLANVNSNTNSQIYTLIALDSLAEGKASPELKQEFIDNILALEISGGGWSFAGETPSVDMTAMALAALAPHADQAPVQEAINRGFNYLSNAQLENGGFYEEFSGGDNSEAVSQTIIALAANQRNPLDPAFVKSQGDLLSHLLDFQRADGGFAHLIDDQASSPISSEQALLALVAYDLYQADHTSVYMPSHQERVPDRKSSSASEEQEADPVATESQQGAGEKSAQSDSSSQEGQTNSSEQEQVASQETKTTTAEKATQEERADRLPKSGTSIGLALLGVTLSATGISLTFRRKNK